MLFNPAKIEMIQFRVPLIFSIFIQHESDVLKVSLKC